MLIVRETTNLDTALQALMKTHHLKTVPTTCKSVYRPFWLGKVCYHAEKKKGVPVDGIVIFLADARILSWTVLGVYQHQNIPDVLDLREHHANFVAEERQPEQPSETLEPLLAKEELPTKSRLLSSRRLLARAMKLGKISFDDTVEYHLIYRPYWEIEFKTRRGETDVALVSRDDLLVRKR